MPSPVAGGGATPGPPCPAKRFSHPAATAHPTVCRSAPTRGACPLSGDPVFTFAQAKLHRSPSVQGRPFPAGQPHRSCHVAAREREEQAAAARFSGSLHEDAGAHRYDRPDREAAVCAGPRTPHRAPRERHSEAPRVGPATHAGGPEGLPATRGARRRICAASSLRWHHVAR